MRGIDRIVIDHIYETTSIQESDSNRDRDIISNYLKTSHTYNKISHFSNVNQNPSVVTRVPLPRPRSTQTPTKHQTNSHQHTSLHHNPLPPPNTNPIPNKKHNHPDTPKHGRKSSYGSISHLPSPSPSASRFSVFELVKHCYKVGLLFFGRGGDCGIFGIGEEGRGGGD